MQIKRLSKYMFPAIVGTDSRDSGVYDADTIYCDLSLGFGVKYENQTFRLYGINAYEVRRNASKGIAEEHVKKGKLGRDETRNLMPDGTEIMIESIKDGKGKYGRYLAIVYVPVESNPINLDGIRLLAVDSDDPTHFCLNDWLVREGHAWVQKY